ncbi:DNA-binding LytR/AlgR family response regulator [Clostridiales Family XIII bacterium PM5-7]
MKIHKMDDTLLQLINSLRIKEEIIVGYKGEEIHRISLSEVYYFEAVEKKTFLYLEQEVYEIKERLYQIEEKYSDTDFVRISKSVIVNVNKIVSVSPELSGRLSAKLENGEKQQISRFYVNLLKQKLGLEV